MVHSLFDYTTLRLIWWVLLGVLLIGFAVTDGFDMGVGALLPFVAKNDTERRVAINTIGPVWEGNQVWFILGGGAIFAAWPALYALSFSGFYLAMFLVLFALILRPVGFKYRSKRESIAWRRNWDWALFVGGAVPALIFGVAVGNTLKACPSISPTICGQSMKAPCSACSILWRSTADWFRSQCWSCTAQHGLASRRKGRWPSALPPLG